MLICDSHSDTLYKRAISLSPEQEDYDIRLSNIKSTRDTVVQAMALFISPGGMTEAPTIAEKELYALNTLKKQGWRQIRQIKEAVPGEGNLLLTVEGGEIFGSNVDNVYKYADLGARIAALTWNGENLIAYPALGNNKSGLKPFGREIVKAMHSCHMAVDISHLNEAGADELMDGPVAPIASHSCAKALCDHPRNLSDQQLRKLFRVGGHVGVNFYPGFLDPSETADIDTVVDHIAYMCDLGGENFVGFGSDFDGIERHPVGLRGNGDFAGLIDRMRRRRFDEILVQKIAGLNFRQYMDRIDQSTEI